jgi:hypothetical protein
MDTNLMLLFIGITISVIIRNRGNQAVEPFNGNEKNVVGIKDPAAFQLRENNHYREFQFEVPVRY